MRLPAEDLQHILQHTEGVWEGLRNQRIFITGGTGFFGKWLVESFASANEVLGLNAQAFVLTRDPSAFAAKAPHLASNPALQLWAGDVTSFPFPPGEFSHIIHAATTSSAPVGHGEMLATILRGTERVLEFARQAGTRQFLFTSSGAVYGKQPPEITHVPETYAGGHLLEANAASVYGEGKRMAELLCSIARHESGLETKIARCFAFVGSHLPLDAHFAIGNFIRDALAGRPIHIQGDGTPYRSYLYAADLAVWLWTILFKGEPGRAYNVGSPESISIAELAQTIGAMFTIPVTIAKKADPSIAPARYVPDTARATAELHLQVRVPLEAAIQRTASFARSAYSPKG